MSPDGQPLCVWSIDSRNFAVHIPPELLRRIAAEAWIGFKRVPRRGLEIGGILLGRSDRQNQLTRFWVDGFELLDSEHRSGPSYILSESDLATLDAMLARHAPSCIGVFRSHTRAEQPILQPSDAKLWERSCPQGDALFLVLVPVKGVGSLFARANGTVKCVHEFALTSMAARIESPQPAMAGPEVPKLAEQEERDHAPENFHPPPSDSYLKVSEEPQPQQYSRRLFGYDLKSSIWVIAGMLIPLVLALAASMISPSMNRSAARKENPLPRFLPLAVDQSGSLVTVHWDPRSPAIQGAERAILHIEDGDYQTDRHLAQRDLQDGAFTYQPRSSGVLFQIELYSQQPSAFGLAQAANLVRAPSAPVESARTEATKFRSPESPSRSLVSVDKEVFSPNRATGASPTAKALSYSATQSQPAETIHERTGAESNHPTLTPAESPTLAPVESTALASPAEAVSRPAEAPGRRLSVDVSTEPVSASLLGRVVEKIPLLRRTRRPASVAPIPVYEAQPLLGSQESKRIAEPVSIGVKVSVGETGTVKDAEVVDYGEPPNWSAANAALEAARRWTFQPARIDDAPVPGEVVLRFRFNP